ncbi:unnamed protein product [Spirodela intermedia]|uniref:Uncharacterized protein n=1 Tax=Spirodela intermedia TaxID=51605 RepID=A0A7I8JQP3_SPIIN|nr:unnamed protein product [Spirodela intermedia]CAA6672478.1 unnamed protein product [Spirodela intermedia]
MSSSRRMPNPKTSVFSDDCPVERYSGAMWPTVPLTAKLRQPKVPHHRLAAVVKENVRRFHVSVDYLGVALLVKIQQPSCCSRAILFLVTQLNAGFPAEIDRDDR